MSDAENKKLGLKVRFAEFTQGMLEQLLTELKGKQELPVAVYRGEMVRAAIKIGWLQEPAWTVDDVANQSPAAVRFVAEQADKLYAEATEVPPN